MVFWFCAAVVLLLDRWTKHLVVENIGLGHTVPLLKDFLHLTYIQNPGAAFGLLANKTWLFMFITIFVLAVLIYLQYTLGKNNLGLSLAFSLITGGAVGNFMDRWATGLVIDFIDFRGIWSYIFNVADAAIVMGMILLAWQILRSDLK